MKKLALLLIFMTLLLPAYGLQLKPGEYAGNLHMHTTCSDGANTYEEMVQESLKLGMSFIAVSDHTVCPEIVNLCLNEKRLLCIPAQEYVSREGHVLALNITKALNYEECTGAGHKEWQCDAGPGIQEAIVRAHAQGGFVIAAHPIIPKYKVSENNLQLFDAMECDNFQYSKNNADEARALSVKYGKPCVYDSDAHDKMYLKYTYNICELEKLDATSVIAAIKSGNCREYIPWYVKLQKYLSPSYWSLSSQSPLGTSSIG